jgi:hypothetical protein
MLAKRRLDMLACNGVDRLNHGTGVGALLPDNQGTLIVKAVNHRYAIEARKL